MICNVTTNGWSKVGPIIIPIPNMAFAVLIFQEGKPPIIIVCAVDNKPPPPSPCTKRQNTNVHKLSDKPHIKDDIVKITTDAVNMFFFQTNLIAY